MASKKETPNTPATNDDLFAGLTEEERAELLALTGQDANLRGEKVPVLKVNYCDLEDREGNSIKKGNFVYNQNGKVVKSDDDSDIKVEYIGEDLGKNPEVVVLGYRQQYAFYSDDPKQRCSSQVFGKGENPVGNAMKIECRSGKCPRRQEGIDRQEKCSCQYVVMLRVKVGDEWKPAMMYVKGKSFITFSDYLKSAGRFPLFSAPTKLTDKMEKQGSVTYFVVSFELLKDKPFPVLEGREHMQIAKDSVKALEDFKSRYAAGKSGNKSASNNNTDNDDTAADVAFEVDDDITFD